MSLLQMFRLMSITFLNRFLPHQQSEIFFDLDPFYQQWINIEGYPVLASANVSPYAIKEAAWQIWQMIGHRPNLLQIIAQNQIRFSIIAHNEVTSDIPELGKYLVPHFFYNVRNRGGNCARLCATVFGPEETLLNDYVYSVLIHEFAHALHEEGVNRIDPEFDNQLRATYNEAMAKGLWRDTYASTNFSEYWAEGVGSWFHANAGNTVTTRAALKTYDPGLAILIAEVFGDYDWRYTLPAARTHLPHLQGFNPQEAPRGIKWPPGVLESYEELRNPAINERNEWISLSPYDPSLISILKDSRTRGGRTDILWVNLSGAELLLYHVHPDGTETLARRSSPNDAITQFTMEVGGLFLVKDLTGRNIAVFQAVEKTGRAFVAPTLHLITPGLSKVSGDNQSSVAGAVLSTPFVVEVRDENGSALEGISVTFTVTTGNGTLSVTHTTTDENGRAESTLTLGPNLGATTVEVSATGMGETVAFNTVADAAVDIPDANLLAAIHKALGKASSATITTSDMARLTELNARNASISDLTGLEGATHLTKAGSCSQHCIGSLAVDRINQLDISAAFGQPCFGSLAFGRLNEPDSAASSGKSNIGSLAFGRLNEPDTAGTCTQQHL